MKKTLTIGGASLVITLTTPQKFPVTITGRTFYRDLYAVSIVSGENCFVTKYTCGNAAKTKPEDILYAICNDATSYANSLSKDDFLNEFGYVESGQYTIGVEAYRACKKAYNFLIECGVTQAQINEKANDD